MADLKTTEEDRLYLSGAIHRMGERTGAAAERILDDLDTILSENAKLRALCLEATAHVGMSGLTITPAEHDLRARILAALEAP